MSATSPADQARSGLRARAAGVGLGLLLDRVVGDPRRLHPVAGFGQVALALEGRLLDERASATGQRIAGALFTGVLVGGTTTAILGVSHLIAGNSVGVSSGATPARTAGTIAWNAAVVWSCLGGSSLLQVARRQEELLAAGDIDGSRELLPWLCGRDPAALDRDDLARAVVESVAENTSDAAVCTLFWAAVAGPAGAAAHRASNTLDAMVGHRSPRYQYFGTASARLDDILGYVPSRLAGLLGVVLAPTIGGSAADGSADCESVAGSAAGAMRAWRRDAPGHPSPNAGVVESVCAGALGVRLGGLTPYPYGVEERAILGDGRPVRVEDIGRAVRLQDRIQLATAGLMIAALLRAYRGAGLRPAHTRTGRRHG